MSPQDTRDGDGDVGRGATAEETIRAYYDAIRSGDPLALFFADGEGVVKYGISERLAGGAAVRDGLGEQTETTSEWTVESRDLRVTEYDDHAWFADVVGLAWTDDERSTRNEFETRWSGTLERRDTGGTPDPSGHWRFVGMHVSTAEQF